MSFQLPEEIPGISVTNFLKYAKNKVTGKPVKIFQFKDELKKYISRRKNCSAFKKNEEDKKTKFMKMVEGADLDSTSKSKIIAKINGNSIRFESTLNRAIKTEEYETKRRRHMKKIMGKK